MLVDLLLNTNFHESASFKDELRKQLKAIPDEDDEDDEDD